MINQKVRILGTLVSLITFTYKHRTFRFTDYHSDIISNGLTYRSNYLTRSKIKASGIRARADVEFEFDVESDLAVIVNSADAAYEIAVNIQECYAEDPNNSEYFWWGSVSDNVTNNNITKVSATPVNLDFDRNSSVATYMNSCNNVLGVRLCKVSLAAFTFQATVVNLEENNTKITLSRTVPIGFIETPDTVKYLEAGVLDLDGHAVTIVIANNSTGNSAVYVKTAMQELKIGSIVNLIPGCDGKASTCKNKFNAWQWNNGFYCIPPINPYKKLK